MTKRPKIYEVAIDYSATNTMSGACILSVRSTTKENAIARCVAKVKARHGHVSIDRTSARLSGWNR